MFCSGLYLPILWLVWITVWMPLGFFSESLELLWDVFVCLSVSILRLNDNQLINIAELTKKYTISLSISALKNIRYHTRLDCSAASILSHSAEVDAALHQSTQAAYWRQEAQVLLGRQGSASHCLAAFWRQADTGRNHNHRDVGIPR